jgi:hypothetical protein
VFKAKVKNTDNLVALKKVLVLNEKEGVSAVCSDKFLLQMETVTVVIAIIIVVDVIYLCFFLVSHHSLERNTHFANPET